MFLKNSTGTPKLSAGNQKKEAIPSIITHDMHVLGNIVSEGIVDFDGTLDGNIRADTITIRANGSIKGEVVAVNISVYGKVKGLIRAKNVQLYASCNVEGIIMHETISIEDGAFVDGKFKRTDKLQTSEDDEENSAFPLENADSSTGPELKMLENIRLIR